MRRLYPREGWVRVMHPGLSGENTAEVTVGAFRSVWREKGWEIVPDSWTDEPTSSGARMVHEWAEQVAADHAKRVQERARAMAPPQPRFRARAFRDGDMPDLFTMTVRRAQAEVGPPEMVWTKNGYAAKPETVRCACGARSVAVEVVELGEAGSGTVAGPAIDQCTCPLCCTCHQKLDSERRCVNPWCQLEGATHFYWWTQAELDELPKEPAWKRLRRFRGMP